MASSQAGGVKLPGRPQAREPFREPFPVLYSQGVMHARDAQTGEVRRMSKSAGNVVTRFGRPGNQDDVGPELVFTSPWWIAAASDRVYVADSASWRITRIRLEHAASASCEVRR